MKLLFVLALLGLIAISQETRWAPVPTSHTTALWVSIALSISAYGFLRSGWGHPSGHTAEQRALGTTSNSFYEPRRESILIGFTLVGGILGAMWWGATSWLVLVRGIERISPGRGLINLQVSVFVGILAGGLIGAAAGVLAGEVWERRHRRTRVVRYS